MSMLGIGISGLNVARTALDVTSHNISNVNTAGYSRQTVSQQANLPQYQGFGFIGLGADVTTVSRMFDNFVETELRTSSAAIGSLSVQQQTLRGLDDLLADTKTGVVSSMQGFFAAMQAASANPTSIATRQVVLSEAQNVVDRFQTASNQVEEMRQSARGSVQNSVDRINTLTGQIAEINRQIVTLRDGNSKPPNDLLDQRDTMVLELNKHIKINVIESDDGNYNIFMARGQSLVNGISAGQLELIETENTSNLQMLGANGVKHDIPTADIVGGALHGQLKLLTEDFPRIQIDLGALAIEFTDAVNRQHALGVDLDGNFPGGPTTSTTTGLDQIETLPGAAYQPTQSYAKHGGGVFRDLSQYRFLAENAKYADLATEPYGTTGVQSYNTPSAEEARQMRNAIQSMSVALGNPAQLAVSSGVTAVPVPTVGGSIVKPVVTSMWQVASQHAYDPGPNPPLAPPAVAPDPLDGYEQNFTLKSLFEGVPANGGLAGFVDVTFTAGANPPFTAAINAGVTQPTVPAVQFSVSAVSKSQTQTGVWEFEISGADPTDPTGAREVKIKMAFKAENLPSAAGVTQTFNVRERRLSTTDSAVALDNSNLLAMNALQSAKLMPGSSTSGGSVYTAAGTGGGSRASTLQNFFSQTIGYIGSRSSVAETQLKSQKNAELEIMSKKSDLSGVNLDEEAANLVKFQQAYQAASKVIQVAQDNFSTILDALR